MNWIINFIWDYFPSCKACKKHEEERREILKMIEELLKTQNECLEYMKKLKSK